MTEITARLSTALTDRYQIERHLGEGGMATVYLAEDVKHDRKVALKVLKPELAAVLGTERFVQEIKTTAGLHHPNILPLFDSGEADSFLYYVMPYVEGESLRDRLHRERQLPVEEAVQFTEALAAALDYAHKRGVIHRDIKPENILLQEGVVLMADFGIALAVRAAGGERLTETGLSLGTPAYMSPEQAVGQRDVDARSDVYSLACVTYEMLAGDPPFVASSAQAVIAKHVTDAAPPITTMRPGVNPAVAHALAKALQKVPADRYESARAFATALTSETEGQDRAAKSIVVLPFENMSPDPENEFFADGLTEEIINDLAGIQGLRVISRNSALALKGTAKSTPAIASELGVSHVVTGSVRRAGNALRVMAQLVEVKTDAPIWNEKYAGTIDDVFGIQEEIATKIVAALEVKLTETEKRMIAERPVDDVVAFDLYLRARRELYAWTPGSVDRAAQLVDQALEVVGENPLLLAMRGQVEWMYVNVGIRPEKQHLHRAADFAEKALALDPDHHLGIFVRGIVAAQRGDTLSGLDDLLRAHERQPGDFNIKSEFMRFTQCAGLPSFAHLAEDEVRVDPLTAITWLALAFSRHINGRFGDVSEPARKVVELAGASSPLQIYAAWYLASAGLRDEAIAILEPVGADLSGTVNGSWALFFMHALAGNADQALAEVTPELEWAASFVEVFALAIADGFAAIERHEEAIAWTRTAVSCGFVNYPFLAQHDPFLATMRDDPRFQELLSEVKPRWEAMVEWERSLGDRAG
jgi:serine/threonine-protein kinase